MRCHIAYHCHTQTISDISLSRHNREAADVLGQRALPFALHCFVQIPDKIGRAVST